MLKCVGSHFEVLPFQEWHVTSDPNSSYRAALVGDLVTPPVGAASRVGLGVAAAVGLLVLREGSKRDLSVAVVSSSEHDPLLPAPTGSVGLAVVTGTKPTTTKVPAGTNNNQEHRRFQLYEVKTVDLQTLEITGTLEVSTSTYGCQRTT